MRWIEAGWAQEMRVFRCHLRLNFALQLLLDSGKFGPQLLREFDGKERPDHVKLALFMTVRREIAEPRRETGARSLGDWLRRLRRCLSRSQDGDRRKKEGRPSPIVR